MLVGLWILLKWKIEDFYSPFNPPSKEWPESVNAGSTSTARRSNKMKLAGTP